MQATKIVIVEDEEPTARLLRVLLQKLGFEVAATVVTGVQSIRAAEEFRPDLMLMDIGLKGEMDGIEAARLIRFAFNVPTIFVTGDQQDETYERSKCAKPIGYVLKPFEVKNLKHTIETALHSYRAGSREMEYALRQAEMRYRDLLEYAVHGVFRITKQGRFLEANVALAKMLGYESPEEMMDSLADFADHFVQPELAKEVLRIVEKTGHIKDFEFQVYRKDGSKIWLMQDTRAVLDLEGEVIWFEGIVQNITERKEAELALRQSREYLNNIINCIRDPIFVRDSRRRFVLVNDAFCDWVQRLPHELLGKTAVEVFPELDFSFQDEDERRVLETGQESVTEENLLDAQGNQHVVMTKKSLLIDKDGNRQIVGVIRDITDLKRAEQQRREMESALHQAQKLEAIGQLAAGIAHEINTPIQYVGDNLSFLRDAFNGLQQVLKQQGRLGETLAPALIDKSARPQPEGSMAGINLAYLLKEIPNAISQSLLGIDRVTSIVRAMKEFSHPGNGEKQYIDLNRAIQNALTMCRNEWKYVADVVTDLSPDLPLVHCSPGDINQVILNLVVNAAHAICEAGNGAGKGTILIQTRKGQNWVEIRVHDTGTGIPEQFKPKIFTPFFTTKEVGKGTGLGLAISRSIVVGKHGGSIDFETEAGKGTTFIVRLPLASENDSESHLALKS